jgi:transposase-like protein
MTNSEFALSDLAARLAGTDAILSTSLSDILAVALQELIDAELTATIDAGHGERTADRVTQRNGHRPEDNWIGIVQPYVSVTVDD